MFLVLLSVQGKLTAIKTRGGGSRLRQDICAFSGEFHGHHAPLDSDCFDNAR
jgi:hypothetical protein